MTEELAQSFDVLATQRRRTEMCPRCGLQATGGRVQIIARRYAPNAGTSRQVASVQLSMCEACCIREFGRLESSLYEGVDPSSRAVAARERIGR